MRRATLLLALLLPLAACGSDDDSGGSAGAEGGALPADLCESVQQALAQGWQLSTATATDDLVTCQGHGSTQVFLQLEVTRADSASAARSAVSAVTGDDAFADHSQGQLAQVTDLAVPDAWSGGRVASIRYAATADSPTQQVYTLAGLAGGGHTLRLDLRGPAVPAGQAEVRLDADERTVEVAAEAVWKGVGG